MAFSSEFERQRYSQELHAYTLVQFSAARTLLDQHKAAADKLPAVNAYDYRLEKQPTSRTVYFFHPLFVLLIL